jgi:hypothetical protein
MDIRERLTQLKSAGALTPQHIDAISSNSPDGDVYVRQILERFPIADRPSLGVEIRQWAKSSSSELEDWCEYYDVCMED